MPGTADSAVAVPYQFPEAIRLREALVLAGTLKGQSTAEIAKEADCHPRSVRRIRAKHAEWLDEQKREHQRALMNEWGEVQGALVSTAKDTENKNQVGAAKVLAENVLGWGGRQGDHIGDVHIHGDVDMRSLSIGGDLAARMEQIRDQLGT